MSSEGSGARVVRPRTVWLVMLVGTIAAVAYTFPLIVHFREAIPYGYGVSPERRVQGLVPGDQLQFYYALALTDDMVHGRVPWFEDPYQFSAPRASTRKSFFFLPFSLLFASAAPLGRATAYNLLMLLSFPATALSTFLLARRLGLETGGAALAAAAITVLPYRVANVAGGHPTGITFFLLPLVMYFLEAAWQQASRRAAAGAGLGFVCLAVNEPHFLYFFVFLLPLWMLSVAWRIEPGRRAPAVGEWCGWILLSALGPTSALAIHAARHRGTDWTPASLAALFAVVSVILAIAWRGTAEIRAREGEEAWRDEARSFAPLLLLLLYAAQLRLDLPYLGPALGAVTLLALLLAKRRLLRSLVVLARRPETRAALRRLGALWPAVVGLAAAVLLLLQYKASFIDPAGHAGGRSLREIRLFAPWPGDFFRRSSTVLTREVYPGAAVGALALVALATPAGRVLVAVALAFAALALGPHAPQWLPLYPAAFRLVPFFGIIRQPAKLFAVTALALALAAGFAAGWLGRRIGRLGGRAVTYLALAAILVDFASVLPLGVSRLPEENRAYDEVSRRAQGSNLLELPLWPGDSAFSSIYQYWATKTRVPIVNGYSPTGPRDYVERVARPLASMNLGELDEAQHGLLDELGVRLVTLHRDTYPPQVGLYPYRFALAAMRRDPNLHPVAEDDGVHLFARVEGPYRAWDPSTPWPMGAFFEAESLKVGDGARVEDGSASGGMVVRGGGGEDLPVVFGPYRPLPRGRYVVRFRVRGRGSIEVTADLGKAKLASSSVDRTEWAEVPLELTIDRPRTVELRAWQEPSAGPALQIDWMLVTKQDGARPDAAPSRFEAEDLTALYGADRESPEASGHAFAVVVEYPPDAVTRDGPYRIYEPGVVHVGVRSRGGALRLRVESADGRRRYADRPVPAQPAWATFETDVDLPERTILCTRLVSAGETADVDYVEITSRRRAGRSSPSERSSRGNYSSPIVTGR